jgi:hypothetical protein
MDIIRIPNIETYTQEIKDGVLILTPKLDVITEAELLPQLTSTKILECTIKHGDETISLATKYRSLLIDIWKSMPTQKILQTTTCNFKLTNENGLNGYDWCESIRMSFQSKDSKGSFKEIIHMLMVNSYTIYLRVQLSSGKIVIFQK